MTAITGSTLEKIRWACQGWGTIFNDNIQRLEDNLLKLSNLLDVDKSGLADENVLRWNGTKWLPVSSGFMTTTTAPPTTTS